MATLYRKKDQNGKALSSWYCFFRALDRDGNVKQVHRSTRETTKGRAQKKAQDLEQAFKNDQGSGDAKSRDILGVLQAAGDLALRGQLNHLSGRRFLNQILKISEGVEMEQYSFTRWSAVWLQEKSNSVEPATVAFYKTALKRFRLYLGTKAEDNLDKLRHEDIIGYRSYLKDDEMLADKSINHLIKGLRACLSSAKKRNLLELDPTENIQKLQERNSVTRKPFKPEQLAALFTVTKDEDWRGMMLTALYTGLRISDVANLVSDNVNLNEKIIVVTPRKTKDKLTNLVIPIHAELQNYFNNSPPSPFGKAPLFQSLAKISTGGRKGLSANFKKIMLKAEIDPLMIRRKGDGAARDNSELGFHSFRHTFITSLTNAGVREEIRKKLSGHSDHGDVHARYTHHDLTILRQAIDKLPSLSGLNGNTRKQGTP